jgi:hypothetical protein
MALIGNGFRLNGIGKLFGGTALDGANPSVHEYRYHLTAAKRNQFAGEGGFSLVASVPNGTRHPVAWVMPRKAGGLATTGSVIGSGGVSSATMQSGYNIEATITGDGGITSATLGLIVSIAASLVGGVGGGITSATANALATMVATLTGSSSVTATLQGLADLGAVLNGSGSVVGGNTALMDITATIRGYGDLTPEGIRDSVWNAALASYQTTGSAGKALSTASSGGVDVSALAAAVWAYTTRTLTAGGAAPTAEEVADAVRVELAAELAQLTKVSKIHGVGVPLVVTATSRVAGDLSQTISTVSGTTTVSAA